MEKQSGLSELSVISWVSAVEGCPSSRVPLYILYLTMEQGQSRQPQDARQPASLHLEASRQCCLCSLSTNSLPSSSDPGCLVRGKSI